MPYLVDGHNLIPYLGLRLDSIDDELQLVARLGEFCRLRRTRVDVYFDGAPPGMARSRRYGGATAHFVRQGSSADTAIEARLTRLGREARNWSVVSSDRRLQRAARAVHAGVLPSGEFVRLMAQAKIEGVSASKIEAHLGPDEVEEWLTMFRSRPQKP